MKSHEKENNITMSDKDAKCVYTEYTTSNGYTDFINDLKADYFGIKLRHLRKEKKLSQSEVAEALGVSQGAISYWEKGEKLPDLNTFWLLCQFLDVEPNYLLGSYRDITASTGLTDDSLRVLAEWQHNPPPAWLIDDEAGKNEYTEVNLNEKPPCLRAEVLNNLCFKYPDIFGKILDKLVVFMISDNDKLEVINDDCKHIPEGERGFYFNFAPFVFEDYNHNISPHITLDIDTLKQITQLEIMELLRDLREVAIKDNNNKIAGIYQR